MSEVYSIDSPIVYQPWFDDVVAYLEFYETVY